jgi:hypothetical protein
MKAILILLLAVVCSQHASAQTVLFEELPLPPAADFVGDFAYWGPTSLYSNGGDTIFVRLSTGKIYVSRDGGQHWDLKGEVPGDFTGSILTQGALTPNGLANIHWEMQGDSWYGSGFTPPLPKEKHDPNNDYHNMILFDAGMETGGTEVMVDHLYLERGMAIGRNDRILIPFTSTSETRSGIRIIDGYDESVRDTFINIEGRTERLIAHANGEILLISQASAAFSTDNGETWVEVPKPTNVSHIASLSGDGTMIIVNNHTVLVHDIREGTVISERTTPEVLDFSTHGYISHTGAVLIGNYRRSFLTYDLGVSWHEFEHSVERMPLRGNTLYSIEGAFLYRVDIEGTKTNITGNLYNAYETSSVRLLSERDVLALSFERRNYYSESPNFVMVSFDSGASWETSLSQKGIIRDLFPMPDGRVGFAGESHAFLDVLNKQFSPHPSDLESRIMVHANGTEFALLNRDVFFIYYSADQYRTLPRAYGIWKRLSGGNEQAWVDIRPDMAFYQIGSYSDGRIVARGGILDTPNPSDHRTLIHLYESEDAGETWTQLTDEPSTVKFFQHDHDLMRVFRVNQDRWLEMYTEGVSIPLFQLNATEIPKNLLTFASNAMVFQTSEGFYGTMDGGSQWIPLQYPFDANKVDVVNAGGHLVAIDREALRLYRTQTVYPTSINSPISAPTASGVSVTTYPNPTRSNVAFQVDLADGADVEITVYDLLGRRVATLHPSRMPSGTHTLTMSMSHLSKGVYVYSMKVGNTMITGRIVRM